MFKLSTPDRRSPSGWSRTDGNHPSKDSDSPTLSVLPIPDSTPTESDWTPQALRREIMCELTLLLLAVTPARPADGSAAALITVLRHGLSQTHATMYG